MGSRPGDSLRRGLRWGCRSRPARPESLLLLDELLEDEDEPLLLVEYEALSSSSLTAPPRRIATDCGADFRARKRGDRRGHCGGLVGNFILPATAFVLLLSGVLSGHTPALPFPEQGPAGMQDLSPRFLRVGRQKTR